MKTPDISAYTNLIENHAYDGVIGTYTGPDKGSLVKDGVYLIKTPKPDYTNAYKLQESTWYNKKYRTLEIPYTEAEIIEEREKFGEKAHKVAKTVTFVPVEFVKELPKN